MKEIIALTSMSGSAFWLSMGLWFLVALPGLAFIWFTLEAKNTSLEIGDDALKVSVPIWGKMFAYSDLDFDGARAVNLRQDEDYYRTVRLNGVGMPGYQLGWFRLENGREAWVHMGDGVQAIYIPTTDRKAILLGVDNPQQVLDAIKAKAL